MATSTEDALSILTQGTAKIIPEKELKEKLEKGKPLRVKLGVDPTAPDIHLGHTVAIEKLRQFQELGHTAVLIIGDFTATVGDPTGRSAARPPITREEVIANAETYTTQAFKILDPEKTEVVYNGEWFRKMTYEEVLKLNARVTMQQMMQREDFKKRINEGTEVRLHETISLVEIFKRKKTCHNKSLFSCHFLKVWTVSKKCPSLPKTISACLNLPRKW